MYWGGVGIAVSINKTDALERHTSADHLSMVAERQWTPNHKTALSKRRLETSKPPSGYLAIPRGLGPIMPAAATARLPFAYSTNIFNDATYDWVYGTAINLGVTNCYSPISGTHQPYGFDQMAALYRYYKVVGFTYKITGVQYIAACASALGVREVPVNENKSLTATDIAQAAERPGMRWKLTTAGNGVPPSISGVVNIPALLGVSQEQFDADVSEYAALCTAAPNRYPYIQISVAGNNAAVFMRLMIECVYTVNFWQRVTQSQS